MKKIFTFVSAVVLALGLQAATLDTIQVDGLYYQINATDSIATLIRYNTSSKYEIEDIVIPVNVVKDEVSYPVVALGQGALRNTTAKTITFAEGSQVKELGMQAFQGAVNVEELVLPEGIKLIPMTGIHNASAPMQIKRLVLPSTVDSLALFSICLPQLETLEFKGAVPPSIATKETATWTQNPWMISTSSENNTNKEAVVMVPAGAAEVYKNTAWIGDYFTTIMAEKDTIQVEGLYYELDNRAQTATLIRLNASSKYEIDTIVIPVTVRQDEREYPVVALGQGALRNTTAKAIIFEEGSKVTELGMQAFQGAVNVEELVLPEGIKLIPMTGIHNASAPMQIKRLVLPSTVDSLALFSICLPQLETLEFKGAVPPSIATKETATWTQNPWMISTSSANNTNKEAVVIVPDGALEAYQNTAWIGDYFTTIVEKSNYAKAVSTIAEFNESVADGEKVKLTLTDAKVTAYADLQGVYYVEDATAATVVKGTALTVGTALNGVIVGTKSIEDVDYINDPSQAYEHMLTVTDASGVTATETELVPTVMTIPEACAQANYAKLITIENVTVSGGNNKTLTDAEENTIKARDLFGVLSADYTWPTRVEKITGICLYYMTGWFIIPISEEAIVANTEAIDNIDAENGKAVKFIENGQLYIRYNGRIYNVLGF